MFLPRAIALLGLVLVSACGGDSGGPGNPFLNGSFEVRIDGTPFEAEIAAVIEFEPLLGVVAGNEAEDAVAITWTDGGTGTYPIGAGTDTQASYTRGDAEWVAGGAEGSGSVVVTTRTATRVAGTFSLVLQPVQGTGATGTRTLTQGRFDLRY